MIGRTISHYKIADKLGEGGMGVVYRAGDTKLDRDVALKFLAPHLLSDDGVRQRFEREAKAAAALDHPNICPVYEIDEAQGQSFIAMRLVDGESLDARIAKAPLKLTEALQIGEQVAQGLKAAHAKGVVHRDIKPQNVMVGDDNRVTLMDFGLAHLADRSRITKADTSLGTVAYMSPEQAEGRQVDHRADIWALGCVLYEMVAGERPFLGEFDQAVLHSVLNEQPEPLTALRTDVPVALEILVDKCLAKKPEERYQSAAELAVDLRSLGNKLASGTRIATSRADRSMASLRVPEREPAPRRAWMPWVLSACLALAAVVAWLAPRSEVEPNRQVFRFAIQPPDGAVVKSFEVSPDGSALAFVAEEEDAVRLWVRPFADSVATPVRGTEGTDPLGAPFWSPDSRFVAYFANEKLMKVGLAGQPPIEICDAPLGRGGSWSPNGKIVFTPLNHGARARLFEVDSNGGEPTQITREDRANSHRSAYFLPGGENYLFHARHDLANMEIMLGSLGLEETRPLLEAETHAVFHPAGPTASSGYLLRVRDSVLLGHPFDASTGEITGGEIPVEMEVGADLRMSRGLFSVAGNVLAYASQNVPWPQRQLVWVDRQGREVEPVGAIGTYQSLRLSPDESRVSLAVGYATRNTAAEVMDLSTGNRFEPAPNFFPVSPAPWSADGSSYLGGGRDSKGVLRAYWISVSGAAPQPIPRSHDCRPWDSSRDGTWILCVEQESKLLAVSTSEGEREPMVLVEGQSRLRFARFSVDGAFVAYSSDVSGRQEVYVRSFSQTGIARMASMGGGSRPVWRGDGRELYYLSADGNVVAVPIAWDAGGDLRIGSPEPLFPLRLSENNQDRYFFYDAASDGNRFLITSTLAETLPTPVQVVVNWELELERLAAERRAR